MSFQSSEGMRQVRLRLAACRMSPRGETMSDLPGGKWNFSPTRHVSCSDSHLFLFLKCTVPVIVCVVAHSESIKIIFLCFQQKADYHVLRGEQKVEEEEEDVQREEEGDDHFFTSRHECPLVQQKVNESPSWSCQAKLALMIIISL